MSLKCSSFFIWYSNNNQIVLFWRNNWWYQEQLDAKGITKKDNFKFSLHHNELLAVKKKPGAKFIYDESTEHEGKEMLYDGNIWEIVKFTATNNDDTGRFEVKPRYALCKKQLTPNVSSMIEMKKYATDVLGNLYEVKENKLKLEFELKFYSKNAK